ncbi:MAG: trehalase [Maribacter sp.]|nr:trehalase [Maribacter sp.]
MNKETILATLFILTLFCCKENNPINTGTTIKTNYLEVSQNILNFRSSPKVSSARDMLMFSDQGAWFAYGLPESKPNYGGFSGPFIMTQDNGAWISPNLAQLQINNIAKDKGLIDWGNDLVKQNSYASHLEQTFENKKLRVEQQLVFMSGHTAMQRTKITNISSNEITFNPSINGKLFELGITVSKENNTIKLVSSNSDAIGYIQVLGENHLELKNDHFFEIAVDPVTLVPNGTKEIVLSQTFIFPEYSWSKELKTISEISFDTLINDRKLEKEDELSKLIAKVKPEFNESKYRSLLTKAHLTLQNNWRIPAGEIKYQGLFPSYQYKGFHGFWSWDSWKHAAGLSYYNPQLAKDQMRAMFDFQKDDGFIVDCIYRDTTIEVHNYRDTKPPLAAWAVAKIYEKDLDTDFVKEIYPKLKKYHNWWYKKRDHDKDGLCEYGSTDGTLIAAKWESGMDNAIRFDNSKILRNDEGAYSLDQESVDLNSYLYAEKLYLSKLAIAIGASTEANKFKEDASKLKERIQSQFYSPEDRWFYDTNLEGTKFVKGAGSEGWTALWANTATLGQAEEIKTKMMDPEKFFTKVPFQTMAADHPKFNPLKGYWRGPNWLDQAYFGVKGLSNYKFENEANKAAKQILAGANGLLEKGEPIYENYHPLTGEGLNAKNFSWSAAHIIMLLTEKK